MRPFLYGELQDGWNTVSFCEKQLIIYSQNGKPLFGLKYQPEQKSITVFSRTGEVRSARIGLQYALLTALYQECIGFHGVTLLCGNEIMIMSAPSGTGKTTLAHLLEMYCDAIIINGDFALLRPTEQGVIFEPTPFCGTSGRALDHLCKINRIVFLSQSRINKWYELNGREAMKEFLNNSFIPVWNRNMEKAVKENILRCIPMLKVNAYSFAPTQEAAKTFLSYTMTNDVKTS